MAQKKQIEVIDMGGAKTVAKKKSLIRGVKTTFLIITIAWFACLIWAPLYIKNTYSLYTILQNKSTYISRKKVFFRIIIKDFLHDPDLISAQKEDRRYQMPREKS